MNKLSIANSNLQVIDETGKSFVCKIRPMRGADLPAVVRLDQTSFTLPWPAKSFQYELNENPLSLLWVAEILPGKERPTDMVQAVSTPRIVGMIVIWLVVDEAHIATIAVDPALRGQGIARRLLATALVEAIQREMKSSTLEVRASNLPAQNLYRRFHYEVGGRRPRYYKDNGEDALLMTLGNMDQAYLDWLVNGGWQAERN